MQVCKLTVHYYVLYVIIFSSYRLNNGLNIGDILRFNNYVFKQEKIEFYILTAVDIFFREQLTSSELSPQSSLKLQS